MVLAEWKIGSSPFTNTPLANGNPSAAPIAIDGTARMISGTVIVHGDSWTCDSSCTRLFPQKVSPISRNM